MIEEKYEYSKGFAPSNRTPYWKSLIGKKIIYWKRGLSFYREGIVEEVIGKNVRISGDWFYFAVRACDISRIIVLENNE